MKYAVSFEGLDFTKGLTVSEVYVGDNTNKVGTHKPSFKTLNELAIIMYAYGIAIVEPPSPLQPELFIFNSTADLVDNVAGSKKFMVVTTTEGIEYEITPDGKKPIEAGGGVGSVTVSDPGTGYTSVPDITADSGDAEFTGSLTAVSGAIAAGGTGYAIDDVITLSNGVKVKVLTVNAGAVLTVSISDGGSLSTMTANPVAQTSTTGAGTGATFTLTYGLGAVTVTASGYYADQAPTLTITGGAGNGAAATAVLNEAGSNEYVNNIIVKIGYDTTIDDAVKLQLVIDGNVLFNGDKDADITDMSSLVDWLTGNFGFLGDFDDVSSGNVQAISVTGSTNHDSANFIRLR